MHSHYNRGSENRKHKSRHLVSLALLNSLFYLSVKWDSSSWKLLFWAVATVFVPRFHVLELFSPAFTSVLARAVHVNTLTTWIIDALLWFPCARVSFFFPEMSKCSRAEKADKSLTTCLHLVLYWHVFNHNTNGHLTAKSIFFTLICAVIYSSTLFWCELLRLDERLVLVVLQDVNINGLLLSCAVSLLS